MGPNSEFPPTKQVSNRLNLQCVMFSLPSLINKYTPKLCTNYLTIVSCSCIKCVGPKYLSNSVWVTVFLWHLYKVHREIFQSYKYDRHYPILFFLWIFFFTTGTLLSSSSLLLCILRVSPSEIEASPNIH